MVPTHESGRFTRKRARNDPTGRLERTRTLEAEHGRWCPGGRPPMASRGSPVDAVLAETRAHIKDNADLKKQAIDGWTRVLHFDHYGTEYARKTGKVFLEELKK